MTLVKFNRAPIATSLTSLVDEFFRDFPGTADNLLSIQKGIPPVNIKETQDSYVMEIVAPGFEKADFNVNLEGNLLTVSAERKREVKEEKDKNIRTEFVYRNFKRSFTIDEKIDATRIGASYINGVLVLNLPRKEEVKPAAKEIKIN